MGGTNAPSEEQLELVQARIIELAQSLSDEAMMMDANGYFDECGFDLEARGAQLSAKLKEYCAGCEGYDELDPSIEDHPQPRRMARYLLENVEYEILEKPLPATLLKSKPAVSGAVKVIGGPGDEAKLFGYPRSFVLAIAALVVLVLVALGYIVLAGGFSSGAGASGSEPHVRAHPGGGGGGGGRGGGRKGLRRNGSSIA